MTNKEIQMLSDSTLDNMYYGNDCALEDLRKAYGKERLQHEGYVRLASLQSMIHAERLRRKNDRMKAMMSMPAYLREM